MLTSCLYMIYAECKRNAVQYDKNRDGDFMFRVISFIEKNFKSDMDLSSIAKAFDYEKHYFSSLFHQCFHINFRQFLNIFRFEHACRLLSDKKISLTDIAINCGFGSIRNFNRIFKNMCGITPSEYRTNEFKGK